MARPGTGAATSRGRLPVQSRDRRPALAALALLLIVGGGLGAGLLVYRSGQQSEVLMAAHAIAPGQRVTADDFETARVSHDSGAVIPSSAEHAFVGSYATVGVPAGTLLNALMFRAGKILPPDGVVVGVNLSADQRPAVPVAAGDVVRAYYVVKGSSSDPTPVVGKTITDAARVVSVRSGSTGQDSVTVSLLVDETTAGALISAASTDSVALAELPIGTKPAVDLLSAS